MWSPRAAITKLLVTNHFYWVPNWPSEMYNKLCELIRVEERSFFFATLSLQLRCCVWNFSKSCNPTSCKPRPPNVFDFSGRSKVECDLFDSLTLDRDVNRKYEV
jgi:hypothetical protein